MSEFAFTAAVASTFARHALVHVEREYPNTSDHVLNGPGDARTPRALHPSIFGSDDWRCCVHGYWLLATVLRCHPRIAEAALIRQLFQRQFTEIHVATEIAHLGETNRAGIERPCDWAWLLMLTAELTRHDQADARPWSTAIKPLARAFVGRFTGLLPGATHPIRAGTHFNSAFAIALALEYADTVDDKRFARLLRGRAVAWFAKDVDEQASEPAGDEFLSSALMEAECMRRVLDPIAFTSWFDRFLPRIASGDPGTLFAPAIVSDRGDETLAHLDGLNLSRAWCWRSLAMTFSSDDARVPLMQATADTLFDASYPHISGDSAGEHWLATFALLVLNAA